MPGTDSSALEGRRTEILERLRQHGAHIRHKFRVARQYDLTAEDVKGVLSDITELINEYPEDETSTIKAIKDICPSAISLYYEPQNRPFFFDQVQRIGALLEQV